MPIYPVVLINERQYYATVDPHVFIESITGEGEEREIVYVNMLEKRRWVQRGDCRRCGLGDIGSDAEKRLIIEAGKRIGEAYSVRDPLYDTRLDIPNTPDYDESARAMAKELGIDPYPCGLRFEWLQWVD